MYLSRPLCDKCEHSRYYEPDYDNTRNQAGYYACDKSDHLLLDALVEEPYWENYDPLYFPIKVQGYWNIKGVIQELQDNCPYWLEHVLANDDFKPLKERQHLRSITEQFANNPSHHDRFFKSIGNLPKKTL